MASEAGLKNETTTTSNKRVDWKKQKELEEARKAGTAPPEVDEEGRYDIQLAIYFAAHFVGKNTQKKLITYVSDGKPCKCK